MIQIDLYGQFLTVRGPNFSNILFLLYNFNKRLTTFKMQTVTPKGSNKRKVVTKVDKRFYIVENNELIRYPINIKDDLVRYLEAQYSSGGVEVKKHLPLQPTKLELNHNPNYIARDYQDKYRERIVNWTKNNVLVSLQTGMGKTFISMYTLASMNIKFSIVVLPRYIDKWISDVLDLTDIRREEILVIQGFTNLSNLLQNPKSVLNGYKTFIISLTTINIFIKQYLNNVEELTALGVTPDRLFEHLETTIVLNDETHQEFHNVYKLMLFSNIKLLLCLTATLVTNDKNLERMYDIMIPKDHRIDDIVKYKKYINIYSMMFRLKDRKRIKYRNQFGYNQAIFEASIIRNIDILGNYLKMIHALIEFYFIRNRRSNEKLLIFMGKVEMCMVMVKYLTSEYSNLNIHKYTEEDDYDVIMESDIIVSTIPSSGTALDIPNLVTVIQTVNVDSPQANSQSPGRLREIKGKDVKYVYTWCRDITSHRKYSQNRLKLFRTTAKTITLREYKKLL